ncbi:MAG TPA: HAMP domain-containing sensor histidine kinase [Atribacteraceae bacterium]|nr:HAMP domain-containing sensor histidine kinase [Atribacteraceae bacterium]
MKNYPLALQIWFVFAALILGISVIVLSIMLVTFRSFFTEEIYASIEASQALFEPGELPMMMRERLFRERMDMHHNFRMVRHVLLLPDGQTIPNVRYPPEFLDLIRNQAAAQEGLIGRYRYRVEGNIIFYVIRSVSWRDRTVLLVSSMLDTYRDDLVATLFGRLGWIMILVFAGSIIPALQLARYLTRPLIFLDNHVKEIARRNWQTPVSLERKDEIGRLAKGIDSMRIQLLLQEKAQQSVLQHISHALKTPVMVIRSYLQSITDEVYPKDTLEKTIETLQQEAEGLEKRVRNFLFFTKLDVLVDRPLQLEPFDLANLIHNSIERFRLLRPELTWSISPTPLPIYGERESMTILLENILDNQIRYARSHIDIELQTTEKDIICKVTNDGPLLDPEMIQSLFEVYRTGYRGEFGLGLAIAQKIATRHAGTISAENQPNGVMFLIRLPYLKK